QLPLPSCYRIMATTTHNYIESLLSGTRELPSTPHAWLNARRGAAWEQANALSVPTTRDEDWRFTDLTPLTRLPVRAPLGQHGPAADILPTHVVTESGARLAFVDGVFAPEVSSRA